MIPGIMGAGNGLSKVKKIERKCGMDIINVVAALERVVRHLEQHNEILRSIREEITQMRPEHPVDERNVTKSLEQVLGEENERCKKELTKRATKEGTLVDCDNCRHHAFIYTKPGNSFIKEAKNKEPILDIVNTLVAHDCDMLDARNLLQTILHEARRFPLHDKVSIHAQTLRDSYF